MRGNFSRWKPPLTLPPSIHYTSTYTQTPSKKTIRKSPQDLHHQVKPPPPVLLCSFSRLYLNPSITSVSLSLSAPHCSVHNQITVSDWMRCVWGGGWGHRLLSFSPLTKIVPRLDHRTWAWHIYMQAHITHTRKGSSVVRWLLGANGVMMWKISLFGFIMTAVRRTTQTRLHQYKWRRSVWYGLNAILDLVPTPSWKRLF